LWLLLLSCGHYCRLVVIVFVLWLSLLSCGYNCCLVVIVVILRLLLSYGYH